MCVVSMIGDHYREVLPQRHEWINPITYPITIPPEVSKAEFEALRKDVLEMKELLRKAKLYDEKNNEPDCEMEDKIALLKKVAELVGVDLEEIFARSKQ